MFAVLCDMLISVGKIKKTLYGNLPDTNSKNLRLTLRKNKHPILLTVITPCHRHLKTSFYYLTETRDNLTTNLF